VSVVCLSGRRSLLCVRVRPAERVRRGGSIWVVVSRGATCAPSALSAPLCSHGNRADRKAPTIAVCLSDLRARLGCTCERCCCMYFAIGLFVTAAGEGSRTTGGQPKPPKLARVTSPHTPNPRTRTHINTRSSTHRKENRAKQIREGVLLVLLPLCSQIDFGFGRRPRAVPLKPQN
jgi:hypothetical protein